MEEERGPSWCAKDDWFDEIQRSVDKEQAKSFVEKSEVYETIKFDGNDSVVIYENRFD